MTGMLSYPYTRERCTGRVMRAFILTGTASVLPLGCAGEPALQALQQQGYSDIAYVCDSERETAYPFLARKEGVLVKVITCCNRVKPSCRVIE